MKATYNPEGDGPLDLRTCYEVVDSLVAVICLAHAPNVTAIAQRLSGQIHGVNCKCMQVTA